MPQAVRREVVKQLGGCPPLLLGIQPGSGTLAGGFPCGAYASRPDDMGGPSALATRPQQDRTQQVADRNDWPALASPAAPVYMVMY